MSLIPTRLQAISYIILFFQSHYGHESRLSELTSTLGARSHDHSYSSRGACPLILTSVCLSIPFRLQVMATLEKGDEWQMWEFIRI